MLRRKLWLFLPIALVAVGLGIYTLLVTPRRFFQCLGAPARYLSRPDGSEQRAELPPFQNGNRLRLLVNGDEALPALLDIIDGAEESIRWQVMLFAPDSTGEALAGALARAAGRGVRVQLSFNIDQTVNGTIADGYSREKKQQLNRQMERILVNLRQAGVEVLANPSGADFPLEQAGPEARAIQQQIRANTCVNANHIDHRKILVIDNRTAFIGGMNVGSSYLFSVPPDAEADMVEESARRAREGLPEPWEKWFDAAAIVEGPVVEQMARSFNWRWEVLGGSAIAQQPVEALPDGVPVQWLEQRPGNPQVGAQVMQLIENAQQEIWVASPFVSYDPALEALGSAARRGVRVVFVTPGKHQEMPLSRRIFRELADEMVADGVEVYFNDRRMAHTKLLVVDGQETLVGSFNLNYRSFLHDLEAGALVDDPAFAREVIERVFQPYLAISTPVTEPLNVPWNPLNWIIKPFT